MRIILITQNEPFYLRKNLEYLIENMPSKFQIVGCVLTSASPFGKKESFLKKSIKTFRIFGFNFFLYYSFKFILSILKRDDIFNLLNRKNIPILKLTKNINHVDSIELIKSYNPDLLVSVLGNQIFKKDIINLAQKGCINLHTALLPKYRGLMPSFWVLKNQEKYTGVSVFYVDEGIDSGPIIFQKKIRINGLSQKKLIEKSKKLGMIAIIESIKLIENGNFKLIDNNAKEKTYYSFPTRLDVLEFKKIGKKFF